MRNLYATTGNAKMQVKALSNKTCPKTNYFRKVFLPFAKPDYEMKNVHTVRGTRAVSNLNVTRRRQNAVKFSKVVLRRHRAWRC